MSLFETNHYKDGGAGLHALVIGVGDYQHGADLNVASLTSPAQSAAAMARWLLEERRLPSAELHSLEVLISGEHFTHGNVTSAVASFDQISRAANDWMKRADSHPENQILFYFCGHGFTAPSGNQALLLASDFGATPEPYDHAINFNAMQRSLHACAARRQLLLVDTCRFRDRNDRADEFGRGRSVLPRGDPANDCYQTTLFATHDGDFAEGDPNQPSLFVKGFLEAVSGAASVEEGGRWVVGTSRLPDVINDSLQKVVPPTSQRVYTGGGSVRFPLHELKQPPVVNFSVECNPEELRKQNALHYWLTPNFDEPKDEPLGVKDPNDDWKLSLQAGSYTFAAMQPEGRSGVTRLPLLPATTKVTIECQ